MQMVACSAWLIRNPLLGRHCIAAFENGTSPGSAKQRIRRFIHSVRELRCMAPSSSCGAAGISLSSPTRAADQPCKGIGATTPRESFKHYRWLGDELFRPSWKNSNSQHQRSNTPLPKNLVHTEVLNHARKIIFRRHKPIYINKSRKIISVFFNFKIHWKARYFIKPTLIVKALVNQRTDNIKADIKISTFWNNF